MSQEEQQKIGLKFRNLREEIEMLYSKLSAVDGDRSEHDLVIKQMAGLEGERRCWQQVGPALAEKKVSDVLPILSENRKRLEGTVRMLTESIGTREKELGELQRKHDIRDRT